MENKKMTKKDYFEALAEVVTNAGVENEVELLAFIDRQVELLTKKADSGNSKKAIEVAENMEATFNALAEINRPATATEVADKMGVSGQKASAYLKKLVDAGKVVRTSDKKKTYFSVNAD